jgi:hypothetical protein
MKWAYGVTTVPQRLDGLLPQTLASLARAGFDRPRLFIDGLDNCDVCAVYRRLGLEMTARTPKVTAPKELRPGTRIGNAGNWMLGMIELYVRNPFADRYAMFEDDLAACLGLREYLESCPYPEKGYWNLYTTPENQRLSGGQGWYPTPPPGGKGAVALVFDRRALAAMFTTQYLFSRPHKERRAWHNVDGVIVEALKGAGWKEYCHDPSLVQHVGDLSVLKAGPCPHPRADSFRGEDFNAMELLR